MSNFEKYNKLKEMYDRLNKYSFSPSFNIDKDTIRLFERHSRTDTTEHYINDEIISYIKKGLEVCEHLGGPDISYYGHYEIGKALKSVTLRYIKNQMKKYAKLAKKEAEECLNEVTECSDT
jgi:isocitrate lyase